MTLFHGLSAFPITPSDAHGHVDTDALCRLLERLTDAGVDSVGLLGSTGTYAYLTRDQRRRATEAAAEVLGRRIPLIVSAGALRTDEALHLARDAEAAGADGLLLAPVSYTPLTEEEVYRHFVAVAAATGLPLCIYNNPSTTHFSFGVALLERLARLDNIAAVKMPLPADGDFVGDLTRLNRATPEEFAVGYSGDWGCAAALLAGADAWYSVVAGLFPKSALKLARAAQQGDADAVQHIDGIFEPLWSLFKQFGGLRVMYAAAGSLSVTDAQPPLPLQPLSGVDKDRVAKAVEALGALEGP